MRLYGYEKDDRAAFSEALKDYVSRAGIRMPASLREGKPPETFRGGHGKPFFAEPELRGVSFSRSHTKGYEVVCFSDSGIGVDCEDIRRWDGDPGRPEKIAKRYFTGDERDYIAFGGASSAERFFEVWTAKEAYMKYTGRGFSEGFRSFSVFGLKGAGVVTGRLADVPHIICSVCSGGTDGQVGFASRICGTATVVKRRELPAFACWSPKLEV